MITTIIVDFGGVLTENHVYSTVLDRLAKKYDFESATLLRKLNAHEEDWLTGKESAKDFWTRASAGTGISYEDFYSAFQHWYNWREDLFALLKKLQKKYRLVLHSDNFDILSPVLRKDNHMHVFSRMFFSNEMKKVKKEKAAFEHVLAELHVKPEESVFIDDKEKNLIFPKQLGMHTIQFTSTEQLEEELKKLGVHA